MIRLSTHAHTHTITSHWKTSQWTNMCPFAIAAMPDRERKKDRTILTKKTEKSTKTETTTWTGRLHKRDWSAEETSERASERDHHCDHHWAWSTQKRGEKVWPANSEVKWSSGRRKRVNERETEEAVDSLCTLELRLLPPGHNALYRAAASLSLSLYHGTTITTITTTVSSVQFSSSSVNS